MPKVSVIIPVYGVEKYIERCARSLFEQTLYDLEFIFIDDCTPDKSVEILKNVLKSYPLRQEQTKIIKTHANIGQAGVRRIGIQAASGDYIIHCDSDDWVDLDAYKVMWEKAIEENLDIVICDYFRSDGDSHKRCKGLNEDVYRSKEQYFSMLLKGCASTAIWDKLIRRNIYVLNNIVYPFSNMWEDFVFNIQLTHFSKAIGHIGIPLYYYYNNQSSICHSDVNKRILQVQDNSRIILEFIKTQELSKIYLDELIYFKYYSRSELAMYVGDSKYRKMWRNIYSEINFKFCFSSVISLREKFKFISLYCGAYPVIVRIVQFLKRMAV